MSALDWMFWRQMAPIPPPPKPFEGDVVKVQVAEPPIRPNELKLPSIPKVARLKESLEEALEITNELTVDILMVEDAIDQTKKLCINHIKELEMHLAELKLLKEAHELAIKHCQPEDPNTDESELPKYVYKPLESLEPDDLVYLGERGYTSERSLEVSATESVDRASGLEQADASEESIYTKSGGYNSNPTVVVSSSGVAPVIYDKV
jgi:hypothetical protein